MIYYYLASYQVDITSKILLSKIVLFWCRKRCNSVWYWHQTGTTVVFSPDTLQFWYRVQNGEIHILHIIENSNIQLKNSLFLKFLLLRSAIQEYLQLYINCQSTFYILTKDKYKSSWKMRQNSYSLQESHYRSL